MMTQKNILLTGATGYIGSHLLPLLEKEDDCVRCFVRNPGHLSSSFDYQTQIVKGDLLDKASILQAMQGIDIAFYLVHSMESPENFAEQERMAAIHFAEAASECKVKRIIYLGGLGNSQHHLSSHLKSRQEVGLCLRKYAIGVQVIEFRASIIIGAGSLSFELIRSLCERLPIMITPKWIWNLAQPIAISDVLAYLCKAIEADIGGNPIFEIGGKDQMSYGDIMREYCRQKYLKRWLISVPVLTPWLSSLWLGLVTPLYARVGRKLIESIRIPTVVQNRAAEEIFQVHPMGTKEAIALAIANEDQELSRKQRTNELHSATHQKNIVNRPYGQRRFDVYSIEVHVDPATAFQPIRRLGGETGWYYANALWRIRGWFDLLVGGVGLRRGRCHPDLLNVGDVVDFWCVEAIEPDKRLLLRAEMKLPGKAWLEFEVEPIEKGSLIRQTAIFDPSGINGWMYWYLLYPIHRWLFQGLISKIAHEAEKIQPL